MLGIPLSLNPGDSHASPSDLSFPPVKKYGARAIEILSLGVRFDISIAKVSSRQQTTNKARRTRSSDSSVMDADYAAIIDVSELSDGNCIAIVQVKNEEGKAVAVRNTRFVKGTSTSISNIVEGKYDKLTPIYDLQGRKITVPAKGVYIQNGRKFVVK